MKGLLSLLLVLLFLGMISCESVEKSKETVQSVAKTDTCKSDSKNTYEVFVPEKKSVQEKLPLLVIIDAHGNGAIAIEKFKQSAKQYSVILVASNLVKNGFVNYESAIETLINDVRNKYQVSETIFMTGFSGGARMALGYALTHKLNGLILCGALANADQITAITCPVFAISGMDDFNFMETAQYLFQEQSVPENLKIEFTKSSHNWPDSLILTNAMGFLYLSNQNANSTSVKKSQITDYCQSQIARIETLKKSADFLKAATVARNMSTTAPFNSDKTFASKYSDLVARPEYTNQLNRLKECLNFEIKARQPYIDAFSTKDSSWWKNEIRVLNEKILTEKDSFKTDMYQRINGFLGILCYSFWQPGCERAKC
ncbi:MAG: hypothetical protein IPF54_15555 [Draconibacterium sp.]|nr:hypothetical protein [Draconibacterium sp.]